MNKYKKVINEIRKHKIFLITSHVNPEADSIGSQVAFVELLKAMGKKAFMLNADKPSRRYSFLPNCNNIITLYKNQKYDAICFLDCADTKRIGRIYQGLNLSKRTINIDHHISNDSFADVNLVIEKASSTAEILYDLFKEARVKINKTAAICMYAAVLTDTGSFNYSNVTSNTHKVVADLVKCGIDTNKIYKKAYEEVAPSTIKLLANTLSTLKISADNKIAWVKIDKAMLRKSNASPEDEEDFVNFPRSIKGVKVAMLFTEVEKNKIKVSFRANESADVNKIALCFSGGGHKKASGCTINATMREAEKKVLSVVKRHLR